VLGDSGRGEIALGEARADDAAEEAKGLLELDLGCRCEPYDGAVCLEGTDGLHHRRRRPCSDGLAGEDDRFVDEPKPLGEALPELLQLQRPFEVVAAGARTTFAPPGPPRLTGS